ncbi:Caudovirus prohead protease [Labrenzia sp. THAF191b]|uniref:HK97 family phage prohead protease n=1 Tax=unclassified Labrenzia TaxID=2648686 RepID=UPI00126936F6|nr:MULTISPECIES: HK97 family phage prohead protease [unclassified Labrenzia]QFT00494.1 Caudovirus prohead protease [Labrenzia sp. THAF191b]QFT06807.1 Caudovirus prohead protease [Labrenzia sp. THAF191a]QFT18351.1 Caudovirus prohead protease [Labrenzia sp. THAF187b]
MASKPDTETRCVVRAVEARAADDGRMTVAGYAAVFNRDADIGGCFIETLLPGAFARSISEKDVLAFFNHDRGRVLGRKSAGTLRLREDSKGLAVEIDLPDTSDGRDVKALVERGDLSGMSFGFHVTKEQWDDNGDVPKRTVMEVELIEVSAVSLPAYDGTSLAMRSLEAARADRRQKNFSAAQRRLRMKVNLDARVRSKA